MMVGNSAGMAVWDEITPGFDQEDQTANFGTRVLAESDGSILFESCTLALIQAGGEVRENPNVIAKSFLLGGVCIAVDRSLTVFKDEQCSAVQFNVLFDTIIDSCLITEDGSCVLVGLRGGFIHCVHIPTAQHIFQKDLPGNLGDDFEVLELFCHLVRDDIYNVIIIGHQGQIFRIPNINFHNHIAQDCKEESFNEAFTVEVLSVGLGKVIKCALLETCGSTHGLLFCKSDGISIIPDIEKPNKVIRRSNAFLNRMKKIESIERKSILVCLNNESELMLLCSHTLIVLKTWKDVPVSDFSLVPQAGSSLPHVLMLTRPDDNQQTWLQLAHLPLFEIKFRVKVSTVSHLVALSSEQLEFLYLEGHADRPGPVDTIHVKSLLETQPEFRFERILRRRKFAEAEEFALTFNLDVELVFKGQAKQLMEDLDPWCSRTEHNDRSFDQLLSLLDKIQDIPFVCNVCINAILSDLSQVQTLLHYASKRLSASNCESKDSLNFEICCLCFRLSTFDIINDHCNFEDWLKFCRADLLSECVHLLEQGKMQPATLIWIRHWCEIKPYLTFEKVLQLLEGRTSFLPSPELMQWLQHFIPSVLSALPQAVETLLSWTLRTTHNMEANDELWPKTGLEFAEQLLNLIKVESASNTVLSFCQQYACHNSPLKQLLQLIKSLKQIQQLKDEFVVRVSLAVFMQEDKNKVVTALLNKVAVSNLSQFFHNFLKTYMESWGLDADQVLSDYVKNIVGYSRNYLGYENSAPWEAVIIVLVSCISKCQHQLESIVAAVTAAPVPWSSGILNLADHGLALDHPLTVEIKNQQQLISIKIIYNKYGFSRYGAEKCDFKSCLLHMRCIIKEDRPEMLEDCLQLVALHPKLHLEAHVLCFQRLIEAQQAERAFNNLDQLDSTLKYQCIRRLTNMLSFSRGTWFNSDNYSNVLASLLERLPENSVCSDNSFTKGTLQDLRNCVQIEKEYSCNTRLKERSSTEEKLETLKVCTKELVNRSKNEPLLTKSERLTSLLQLTYDKGLLEYASQALDCNYMDLCVKVAKHLDYPEHPSAHLDDKLTSLCTRLIQGGTHKSVQVAHRLAGQACLQFPLNVMRWLDLFKWSSIASALVGTGDDSSNTLHSFNSNQIETLMKWNLTPLYQDSVLGMKKQTALDLVAGLYEGNVPSEKDLLGVVRQSSKEHYDLTGLKIILLFNFHSPKLDKPLTAIWNESVYALLYKVISNAPLDDVIGLNLLLSIDFHWATSWLNESSKTHKRDIRKLEAISSLGIQFYHHHKLEVEVNKLKELRNYCIWSKRLVKLGTPIQKVINDNLQACKLLQILMSTHNVDLPTLKQFCNDFNLDIHDHIVRYMEAIFLNWKPEIQVLENNCKKSVVVKNSEEEVIEKCLEIIKEVGDNYQEVIINSLDNLWDQINFYHYEMYLALQKILEHLAPKQYARRDRKLLLLFLRDYCRICQPQHQEKEAWLQAFPSTHTLPELAQWRLPFHQFLAKDIWSVVKPEVDLDTYRAWLKVAPVANLDKDVVCCVAIRQTIDKAVSQSSESSDWCQHVKDSSLLEKVRDCVDQCANPESASAALYYVARHTPPGTDQVKAIQLCYQHAQQWAETVPTAQVKECLLKVHTKYLSLTTTGILHKFGLASPHHLSLVLQPCQLVGELYNHPSIVTRAREATTNCPDVNGAVDEIASIHQLNVSKLRVDLLTDYLKWSTGSLDLSVSTPPPTNKEDEESDNLLRSCYIVQAAQSASATTNLLKTLAYSGDEETISLQLQAMRCLCLVSPEDTLLSLFGQSLDTIRKDMQTLSHILSLQSLGMHYSREDLRVCNKVELIKLLWRLPYRSQNVLDLIVKLALDYRLFDSWIWDSLLGEMVHCHMQNELERLLPQIAEHSSIKVTSGFIQAWKYLLATPFLACYAPVTEDQERACVHALELLQSCPVLSDMSVSTIIDGCIQVGVHHLGATLLPYLHRSEREENIQKLIKNCHPDKIIKGLEKSNYGGLLTIPKTIKILKQLGGPL